MKYKILYDYGVKGNKFDDTVFYSVEEAIKHAVAQNYGTPFRIVSVHWEPEYKKEITKN